MALLTPNAVFQMNGVTVKEKIIPDGTRWKDAAKAKAAGFDVGDLYKKQQKLSGNTGKAQWVTIHNTEDLKGVDDDAEQYTRATYPNENMGSARVHYYVDDNGAWQNLKAGTGLCVNDPDGSAEVSWHSGDGSVADGGNMTSLSIEIIMNESAAHDEKAKDNGARIAAWLLHKHGLTVDHLVTHTYWVNKRAGKSFSDVDKQCTNMISGQKWCPTYIFASTNADTALKNWKAFKQLVKNYMGKLSGATAAAAAANSNVIYRSLGIAAMRKKADINGEPAGRCVKGGYYTASQLVTPATGTQQWFRHVGTDLYSALTDIPEAGSVKLFEKYGTYTVGKTTDCVNVRTDAGTDKKIITALPKDTEVYITGKTAQSTGERWAEVVYCGQLAWIAKQYIAC